MYFIENIPLNDRLWGCKFAIGANGASDAFVQTSAPCSGGLARIPIAGKRFLTIFLWALLIYLPIFEISLTVFIGGVVVSFSCYLDFRRFGMLVENNTDLSAEEPVSVKRYNAYLGMCYLFNLCAASSSEKRRPLQPVLYWFQQSNSSTWALSQNPKSRRPFLLIRVTGSGIFVAGFSLLAFLRGQWVLIRLLRHIAWNKTRLDGRAFWMTFILAQYNYRQFLDS